MNSFKELVKKSRSYRRFDESRTISRAELEELTDLARYAPSATNRQPIKYFLSHEREMNEKIFPCLVWAAQLKHWDGPEPGERPTGYIIILGDRTISENVIWDHSINAQTILLGAADIGLAGCMLGAIDKKKLRAELRIEERYDILLVLALGAPGETIVIDPMPSSGETKYFRDENDVHHVPKRSLKEIILN